MKKKCIFFRRERRAELFRSFGGSFGGVFLLFEVEGVDCGDDDGGEISDVFLVEFFWEEGEGDYDGEYFAERFYDFSFGGIEVFDEGEDERYGRVVYDGEGYDYWYYLWVCLRESECWSEVIGCDEWDEIVRGID